MGQRSPALNVRFSPLRPANGWAWALLAVTLLGAALRFAALGTKTLWLDEAFSLWMARHGPLDLFAWLVRIDHHPPLYYLLLHWWSEWWGDTPTALRSLSALTSTLAIPFFALAAAKLVGPRAALVAALLLAISPFHLRYAQEARMYGALTLAAAVMLYALAHLLTAKVDSGRRVGWAWALMAGGEAAAMLTHNTATVTVPLALNMAVGGLWLMQRRGRHGELSGLEDREFWRAWVLSQLGAFILWSPWAWGFVRQAQVVDGDFWIAPPAIWDVWMALGNLTFAHLPDWLPLRDYWSWLALGLVVWGAWVWRRAAGVTWLLLALWLVPPAIELLVSLRRPIFYDRTLIWTTLPYYLLIARGMMMPCVWAKRARAGWLVLTLILFSTLGVLGVRNYYGNFEKEDWDEVARFVAEQAEPQELILFHASWAELPFDYYYQEAAPPLAQHGVPADLFEAGTLEPPMRVQDAQRVRELVAGRDQIWLVYSHWWYTDPDALLLAVLGQGFVVAEEREWPGIRVLRYVRE